MLICVVLFVVIVQPKMKRNGNIKSFFQNYEAAKRRKVAAEEQPEPDIDPLQSIRMQRLALILIHLQSIPMQRLTLILMMKHHDIHHPNIHMQGPIIFKGFHLIQGK